MVHDHAGKADLSKGYWNPKRKFGVTTQFLEIMKQQYSIILKNSKIQQAIYTLFSKLKLYYLRKMHGYLDHLLSSAFFALFLNRAKISLY